MKLSNLSTAAANLRNTEHLSLQKGRIKAHSNETLSKYINKAETKLHLENVKVT